MGEQKKLSSARDKQKTMDSACLWIKVNWNVAHKHQMDVKDDWFCVRACDLRSGAMQHQLQALVKQGTCKMQTPVVLADAIDERMSYDAFWRGWREQTERDLRDSGCSTPYKLCSCQVVHTLWTYRVTLDSEQPSIYAALHNANTHAITIDVCAEEKDGEKTKRNCILLQGLSSLKPQIAN